MGQKDKRIDAKIAQAQDFAKPIMRHLRELVHVGCPEVKETIKWGMPFFEYQGPLCNLAAFKQHVAFGFWKGKLLKDPKSYLQQRSNEGGEAMGQLGKITSLKDLPTDRVLIDFIKQAAKLNADGVKVPVKARQVKKTLVPPDEFLEALRRNKSAWKAFEAFSPSHRREYIEWIVEAKTEATREKRMATAVEWIAEGKGRNWKYQKK